MSRSSADASSARWRRAPDRTPRSGGLGRRMHPCIVATRLAVAACRDRQITLRYVGSQYSRGTCLGTQVPTGNPHDAIPPAGPVHPPRTNEPRPEMATRLPGSSSCRGRHRMYPRLARSRGELAGLIRGLARRCASPGSGSCLPAGRGLGIPGLGRCPVVASSAGYGVAGRAASLEGRIPLDRRSSSGDSVARRGPVGLRRHLLQWRVVRAGPSPRHGSSTRLYRCNNDGHWTRGERSRRVQGSRSSCGLSRHPSRRRV